jgi:hypothetical protein
MARDFSAELEARLKAAGNPQKQAWWENYLASFGLKFYGVPMAEIRNQAQAKWDQLPESEQAMPNVVRLFQHPVAEMKLAGILILETRYLARTTPGDLEALAALFRDGSIADWHITDWLSTKYLSKVILLNDELKAALGRWAEEGHPTWQRRAAVVLLVPHAKTCSDEEAEEMIRLATTSLGTERFAQTGVAWLMAELSHRHAGKVAEWVKEHAGVLCKEALDRASKRLGKRKR